MIGPVSYVRAVPGGEPAVLFADEGGTGHEMVEGSKKPLLAMLIPPIVSWLERGLCLAAAGVCMFGKSGDRGEGSNWLVGLADRVGLADLTLLDSDIFRSSTGGPSLPSERLVAGGSEGKTPSLSR